MDNYAEEKFNMSFDLFKKANTMIRKKEHIIFILLSTILEHQFLTKSSIESVNEFGEVVLCNCKKMNRIIFKLSTNEDGNFDKLYSISNPFYYDANIGSWKLTTNGKTYFLSIELLNILVGFHNDGWFNEKEERKYKDSKKVFETHDFFSFMERIEDEYKSFILNYPDNQEITDEKDIWIIIKYLLSFEPGYLRYDYDDEENRVDIVKHPLNHLDINFTDNCKYKIGLENNSVDDRWKNIGFIELLNDSMPRHYLGNTKN